MFSHISSHSAFFLEACVPYTFGYGHLNFRLKPTERAYNQLFFSELRRKMPGTPESKIRLHNETNESFLNVESNTARHSQWLVDVIRRNRAASNVIRLLRTEMLYLLGHRPELDVPATMTSGATTTCRTGNTPVHRWLEPESTGDLLDFIEDHYIGVDYVFPTTRDRCIVNNYARAAQVAKNVSSNRLIFIPPVCNVTYERMLGEQIGKRLLKRGIDIPKAAEKHKILAYYASILGGLNTDDLRNASNTISTQLVKLIVPPAWYAALDAARCKSFAMTWLDDKGDIRDTTYHHMNMFMGNGCGFCFELETAVFAAVIKVGLKLSNINTLVDYRDIHVYGDDMIYQTAATAKVRGILAMCGFTVHVNKSFSSGFFRESCGGDWLNGLAVRPVHLKSTLSSDREKVIFLNQITRMRRANPSMYTQDVHMVYCEVLSSFESQGNIFFGPEYMGDSVLQCPPFVDFKPPKANRYGVARMKIWSSTPDKVECFETFSYTLPFDSLMKLASNGHLRGLGSVHTDLVNAGRSLDGVQGYNKNGYPMIPKPGTEYTDCVQRTLYFERPCLVDETDPVLSVFKLLSNAPRSVFPLNNYIVFKERSESCRAHAYRLGREIASRRSRLDSAPMSSEQEDDLLLFLG